MDFLDWKNVANVQEGEAKGLFGMYFAFFFPAFLFFKM
jgi:hypothetical protein